VPHVCIKENHQARTNCSYQSGLVIVSLGLCATAATGASISYPDQGPIPSGVTFTNISESSGTDPVPLYGAPTAFPVGLDFNPMSFTAFGTGGSSDITDGQLNFTVQGDTSMWQLVAISSINLLEAGVSVLREPEHRRRRPWPERSYESR
jgi:hypothetical protein